VFSGPSQLAGQSQDHSTATRISAVRFSGRQAVISGSNLFNFSADWNSSEEVLRLRFPRADFSRVMVHLPPPPARNYIRDVRVHSYEGAAADTEAVIVELKASDEHPFTAEVSPSGDRLRLRFGKNEQNGDKGAAEEEKHAELTEENFAVVKLKWADAKDVADILRGFANYGRRAVQVDERLNRLIITTRSEYAPEAIALARRLDTPGRQVLISARIVEINVDAADHLGLSLGDSVSTVFKEQSESYGGIELELQPILRSPLEIRATLNMLSEDGKAQILASPKVATVDGVPAEVKTEERFPVFISETSGDRTYKIKQDIVAGISLSITPRCGEGDKLTTKIHTEVTSITGTTSEGYPTTSTREVETTIRARSGRSIVIGGLLEKRNIEHKDKIPFLGDIPLLGRVFTNFRTKEKKTNLWVVVTPYLIGEE